MLPSIEVTVGDSDLVVVVLHGRSMTGADLAPFAHSLGVSARFVFPDGPCAADRGRSWWPVDSEVRLRALAERGPLDLHALDPPGRLAARAALRELLATFAGSRIALVGFSQGGMLAMDYALSGEAPRVERLALLSSSRIAFGAGVRLPGLPVLVAHGTRDPELAHAAGERLRDLAIAAGATVTWVPFDGPHEIPLVVWRALRKFLAGRHGA